MKRPAVVALFPILAVALPMLSGAPATAAARQGPPGQVSVRSQSAPVEPAGRPQLVTVACDTGEQLLSGGYAADDSAVHVVASYPSDANGTPPTAGDQPTAWTIRVVNDTKNLLRVIVAAQCLSGVDTASSVSSTTLTQGGTVFPVVTHCPAGTVRAGGGFASQVSPALGTGAIVGSYPAPGGGWGVDVAVLPGDPDVSARATVTVYAVCLSGGNIDVADLSPTVLDLSAGTEICTGGSTTFNFNCVTPWTGTQRVTCPTDQALAGGGYQVTTPNLPGNYAVLIDGPATGKTWRVSVNGSTPSSAPISLNVIPVCLVAVVVTPTTTGAAVTPSGTAGPVTGGSDLTLVAYIGGGLLVLLLLVLFAALALRAARRRSGAGSLRPQDAQDQPVGAVGLDVVVRAQRSGYGLNGFRETV